MTATPFAIPRSPDEFYPAIQRSPRGSSFPTFPDASSTPVRAQAASPRTPAMCTLAMWQGLSSLK